MAVEIPVVIDIDRAFDEAAKRVDSASKPFKRHIENSLANLKVKVGVEYDDLGNLKRIEKTVKEITTMKIDRKGVAHLGASMQEVSVALEDAKKQYGELNAIQEKGATVNKTRLYDLQQAIVVLTQELEQRQHSVALVTRETEKIISATRAEEEREAIIMQEATTIAQINERLGALRGKLDNLNPKTTEWKRTAVEIKKTTAELEKYQQKLALLGTKSGSIDRLSVQMQQLTAKWNAMSKTMKFDADGNLKASAQKIVDKYRELTAEAQQYGRSLQSYVAGGTAELKKQAGLLRQMAGYFSGMYAVHSLARFVKQIRDVTGELEYQRVALGHLLQDVQYGNYLFERIKEAAVESPFRIKELVTYTKQLAAYRIEQEDLFDVTKRLADVSAGLGVDMNRLILAYGQVRAASVLRGQELRQFTEAGIPMVELLAEKFTDLRGEMVSTADVFKLISERAVPFEMIADIFDDLTNKGGMFYQMQEEQAKTLMGRWEKLKDAYDIALQSVGETETFQKMNDVVLAGLRFLADNLRTIVKLVDASVVTWGAYNIVTLLTAKRTVAVATAEQQAAIAAAMQGKSVNGLVAKLLALVTGETADIAAKKALTAATTQATVGTNALSRAMGRLKVALLTNPWVALAAAVAGLIVLFTTFRKKVDDSAEAVTRLNKAADEMHTANKQGNRVSGLIKQYEALAQITEKNTAESQSYARVIKKLAAEFPEYKDKLDDNNLSLEQRLELVKALNEEEAKRLQKEKEEKENELEYGENRLAEATSDRDAKKQAKDDAIAYLNTLEETFAQKGGKVGFWDRFFGTGMSILKTSIGIAKKQADEAIKAFNEAEDNVASLEKGVAALKKELYGADTSDSSDAVKAWKDALKQMQVASNGSQIFSNETLEGWTRLYDVSNDLEKEWKKLKEDIDALTAGAENAKNKGGDILRSWQEDLDNAKSKFAGLEIIKEFFGFIWGSNTSSGYTQDPFIKKLQNQMKFMKDFKKGYDDLSKYMNKSGALGQESGIMINRGLSLGIDPAEQKRAAEDLSNWYKDTMDKVMKQAQKYGAGTDMASFLSRQITGNSNKAKALRDFQVLLQSLWDAKTDFDVSQQTKNFQEAFNKMKDELKKSETVKKFYDDILGMTGDASLATTLTVSVYGNVGKDFKQRMQAQLDAAFASMEQGNQTADMSAAIQGQDFDYILAHLEDFPEEWRDVLKNMANDSQKYYADMMMDVVKAYAKVKDYDERRTDVINREAQRRVEIAEWLKREEARIDADTSLDDEGKKAAKKKAQDTAATYTKASQTQQEKDLAAIDVEELKNTYEWTKAFEDLDRVGNQTLANLAIKIQDILDKEGDLLTPEQLKAMNEALEKVKTTQASRDPIQSISIGMQGATLAKQGMSAIQSGDPNAIEAAKKKIEAFNKAAKGTMQLDFDHLEDGFRNANVQIKKGIEGIGEYVNAWSQVAGGLQTIRNYMGEVFDFEDIPIVDEMLSGVTDSLTFIAAILPVITTLNAILNGTLMMNPFIAMAAAIVATIGAVVGLIKGIINAKVEKINNKIEEQDEIIKNLEKDYDALDKAIEDAFGTDYISTFNQQLKVLEAEAAAYREQARLERSKGKKADDDKIQDYLDSADDIEQKIAEMRSQLSEFFSGTDVTSAAKEFAEAWIDAYKEFGFTAGAIKDKFKEMIESMVVNSLAAQLIQKILDPVFEAIDTLAKEGDELSEADIAKIAELAAQKTEEIDAAMTALMQRLAAAGINMRASGSELSGISKDIAGASEESINGLAAGINTQNFYMSFVPVISSNVEAILAAIGGASDSGQNDATRLKAAAAAGVAGSEFGDETFRGQMRRMDENIADLRNMMRSVITPKSANTNTHAVATK